LRKKLKRPSKTRAPARAARTILLLCLAILAWPFPAAADPPFRGLLRPPPEGSLYHGVYPGGRSGEEDDLTPADLQAYEALAGKPAAWVYFSHNWYKGRGFPQETASWIRARGSIPFIRLMLRSSPEQDRREPVFRLERIRGGDFDEDLRAWARGARDFGSPLLVEFGTEVNGRWFPWNGWWNGRGQGPERFRDAYRHIIRTMRAQGADNILWVFHANHADHPRAGWNRLESYYPGDEYIDCIGVSIYGALTPLEEEWPEFRLSMDAVYPRLAALSPGKPLLLLEFGATRDNPLGDPAAWAQRALADLLGGRWPRVAGFSWWNERWQNDDDPAHDTSMRLQDHPDLAAAFRVWVGGQPAVLGRIAQP
jgi:hypothetical protein